MKTRRISILLGVLVLLGVGSGLWWWQQAGVRSQIVSAALPPMPDLSASPPAMVERIRAADTRARKRTTAERGLVELAQLYHANGFLEQAVQSYAGLEQLEPGEPRWWHLHASILAGYGEADDAL